MKVVHVVPTPPDLIEHNTRGDCPCLPRSEPCDGGRVIVHNAADGRL